MTRLLLPLLFFAAPLSAADPAPTFADLDRTAIDVLKEMHNSGADLYNSADAPAPLRTYEAALRTISPFLAHRPKVQQAIADGLVAAAKQEGPKAQAFKLHEVIDQVRTDLKAGLKPDEPKPKPMPMPEPKRVEPKPVTVTPPTFRWPHLFAW